MLAAACRRFRHALELVESEAGQLDGAVLDVNLYGERVFPVAEALSARGVPFVPATGYSETNIPSAYADMPRCEKPVHRLMLMRLLRPRMRD